MRQHTPLEPATGIRQATSVTNPVDLARAAAAGDVDAQKQIFRLLKGSVHATLYRVLGSNRHMEDLVQDAFIEIFRSLSSYRGEAKLTTWADRIAVRAAYRQLRRRELVLSDPEEGTDSTATPERQADMRERVRRLYAAMDQMKPAYRIAFALFELDGRSLAEVASATGVSVITAKSRVWRARRILREAAMRDPVLACQLQDLSEVA
jgi:RNA polymerase sigma-70 factor, ECF subfamily